MLLNMAVSVFWQNINFFFSYNIILCFLLLFFYNQKENDAFYAPFEEEGYIVLLMLVGRPNGFR